MSHGTVPPSPSRSTLVATALPAVFLGSLLIVAACASDGSERSNGQAGPQGPLAAGWAPSGGPGAPLLVRGRIERERLVLEPVFQLDMPVREPGAGEDRHRLRGYDRNGDLVFEVGFDATEVADLPDGLQEHFTFTLPLEEDQVRRLHRLELETSDGRRTGRSASLSDRELERTLEPGDAVSVERISEDRVRVRWDPEAFPMIMIRSPETGRILAFLREGDATVATELDRLEIVVSDGIRSLAKELVVRSR